MVGNNFLPLPLKVDYITYQILTIMEIAFYWSKKIKLRVEREILQDGSFYLHLYELSGKPYPYAAALIGQFGGVDGFWGRCLDEFQFQQKLEQWKKDNSPEKLAERKRREAERIAAIEKARVVLFENLVAQGLPIPSTYENIGIVLRYLNTKNWSGWELPAMSIGYRCNQYDCDGRQASTMILDEPIDVDGENVSRFVVGAPVGHLMNYHRC